MVDFRERRKTTTATVDVDDALEGARELDGTGMPRPDLDGDGDEHADEDDFGREAAWPEPTRHGRVAQIGCDLGPPDSSRPASVSTPSDQHTWQGLGGAAAKHTGR